MQAPCCLRVQSQQPGNSNAAAALGTVGILCQVGSRCARHFHFQKYKCSMLSTRRTPPGGLDSLYKSTKGQSQVKTCLRVIRTKCAVHRVVVLQQSATHSVLRWSMRTMHDNAAYKHPPQL